MILNVAISTDCQVEKEWILKVMLGEFLGLNYTISYVENEIDFLISMHKKEIRLKNEFFQKAELNWLKPETLPNTPLKNWDPSRCFLDVPLLLEPVPVLYGEPKVVIDTHDINIGMDIFGTAFFMLSRYEEAIPNGCDRHNRFPSAQSIAAQGRFLHRPIVNEYLELLWAAMKALWPELKRSLRQPSLSVSCDVDVPYAPYLHSWRSTIKEVLRSLILKRSVKKSWNVILNKLSSSYNCYIFDTNDTFDWLMTLNESENNVIDFYFISDQKSSLDGNYSLDEDRIRRLLREIHRRGHRIGLHASYTSYLDERQMQLEVRRLRQVMEAENIHQAELGVRQHYLRLQVPYTFRYQNTAGLIYDSSLSFADSPGFRCGSCYRFTMYDVQLRTPLTIRQHPLILMECSVIAEKYLNMGYSKESLDLMRSYRDTCYRFSGEFTLLWHNSHFENQEDRIFYTDLIKH